MRGYLRRWRLMRLGKSLISIVRKILIWTILKLSRKLGKGYTCGCICIFIPTLKQHSLLTCLCVSGTVEESYLVDGALFDQKTAGTFGGPTKIEKAKIGLIQFQISPPKTDVISLIHIFILLSSLNMLFIDGKSSNCVWLYTNGSCSTWRTHVYIEHRETNQKGRMQRVDDSKINLTVLLNIWFLQVVMLFGPPSMYCTSIGMLWMIWRCISFPSQRSWLFVT